MNHGALRAFNVASNLPHYGWKPFVIAPPDLQPPFQGMGAGSETLICRTGEAFNARGLDHDSIALFLRGGMIPAGGVAARVLPRIFSAPHPLSTWEKQASALAEEIIQTEGSIEGIYVQGPPAAAVSLALDLSQKHSLPVLFDLTAPLDQPGSAALPSAVRESDLQKLEERVLTSGYPVITPTRALKEYFLKKYFGRTAHSDISIIPDTALPLPMAIAKAGASFRPVIFLEGLDSEEMRLLFSSLAAFLQGHASLGSSMAIVVVTAEIQAARKLAKKYRIGDSVELRSAKSAGEEVELALGGDVVGLVSGSAEPCRLRVPDPLLIAVGLGRPVFALGPDGAGKQFSVESGGMHLDGGGDGAPREMLQLCFERWRQGTLSSSKSQLPERCRPERVFRDLGKIIAFMLPV